jgi:hypothetical protein
MNRKLRTTAISRIPLLQGFVLDAKARQGEVRRRNHYQSMPVGENAKNYVYEIIRLVRLRGGGYLARHGPRAQSWRSHG